MNDSKVLAFIFGLIPMTLIQYWYWNWLIDETIDGNRELEEIFLVLVIVVLIYCVYERFIVFSLIADNTGLSDRIPLAVFWVLESVTGGLIFVKILNDQLPSSGYAGSLEMITKWWSIFACGLICCFVFCRILLYKKWEYHFSGFKLEKGMGMNNKKIRSFIFGLIPMTLIQCYYWNWMIKSSTVNIDNVNSLEELFFIPVCAAVIYCVYEKFIVFSMNFVDTTFNNKIPLTVLWILESMIGTIVSNRAVYDYEKKYTFEATGGYRALMCLFSGGILIVSFLFCRIILYKKEEN